MERRAVIARPDAAIAVRPDVGGARKEQKALVQKFFKPFRGSFGHLRAENVMHIPMGDRLSVHIVRKALIVGKARAALIERIAARLIAQAARIVFAIKDGGLVHVVPEPFEAEVGIKLVLPSEPLARLRLQEIGEVRQPRPHGGLKVFPFQIFAEIPLFDALFIDGVMGLYFDARVDDGHEPDAARLHLLDKPLHVGETLFVDREVDIAVHVVDIEADIFERHPRLFVAGGDLAHVLLRLISPAALPEAERP